MAVPRGWRGEGGRRLTGESTEKPAVPEGPLHHIPRCGSSFKELTLGAPGVGCVELQAATHVFPFLLVVIIIANVLCLLFLAALACSAVQVPTVPGQELRRQGGKVGRQVSWKPRRVEPRKISRRAVAPRTIPAKNVRVRVLAAAHGPRAFRWVAVEARRALFVHSRGTKVLVHELGHLLVHGPMVTGVRGYRV